ncbi:hypothetical protein [Salinifilum ghardaiensis]
MNLDRTNDQELYDELLNRLSNEAGGHARASEDGSRIELSGWWEQEPLDETLRLHVTPRSLGEHLREMEDGIDLVFPDVQPVVGALQLFLVHIDEAIATRKSGETELVVRADGVWSIPPDRSQGTP